MGILRGWKWKHSKGRNVPYHWSANLIDIPNLGSVRPEINEIIREIRK